MKAEVIELARKMEKKIDELVDMAQTKAKTKPIPGRGIKPGKGKGKFNLGVL